MTATHVATLHTSAGDIKVNLYGNHAPKTVKNFLDLASGAREWTDPKTGEKSNANLYDGTIFHRVIDNFMIQGGDPVGQGTGGPGYTFDDEIHPELVFDRPYLFAMANAGLRRDPITGKPAGTNGSQFFITTTATGWLNGKHTIFGEVVDGDSRAVVDSIGKTRTGAADRPVTDITINSITVEDA